MKVRMRLTRAQVREIDRRSIEDYHIPGIVLMENAARAVTDVATEMLRGVDNPRVFIVCGGGNNGGDGLAVARHLHNRRVGVRSDCAGFHGYHRPAEGYGPHKEMTIPEALGRNP